MFTIILFPVGLSILRERQPYFNSLDDLINSLNEADNTPPIDINDFQEEISNINELLDSEEQLILQKSLDVNRSYYRGKLNRTVMWILISIISIPISSMALVVPLWGLPLLAISISLLVHKIQLLSTLWKLV